MAFNSLTSALRLSPYKASQVPNLQGFFVGHLLESALFRFGIILKASYDRSSDDPTHDAIEYAVSRDGVSDWLFAISGL
ncbi:hypothetical protein GCM10011350_20800 [Marinomonas arctica]|nr:hypothetical protein GCM10011350_20800 [Marinomonas arctica]